MESVIEAVGLNEFSADVASFVRAHYLILTHLSVERKTVIQPQQLFLSNQVPVSLQI